jgi:phage shock protein PspC (stress-responsive transcriptional regulator)
MNDLPAPTSRARHGRWLGGVCAGLATRWDVPPARVRLAFALGALALGLGVLVYLAAWLILPPAGEDGTTPGQRGIVLLAQACGALLGLGTLAAAGAAATVFGFGWVVVALAAAVLVGTLAGWARLGPAWALLPIGALVLPSVAMAVGGLRVEPSSTSVVLAPRTLAELPRDRLTSGLGTLTLDLRRTALPVSGGIPLRIEAGVRRTLIALPHDRCVHVSVNQRDQPLALDFARALVGDVSQGQPSPQIFGEWRTPHYSTPRERSGPVLEIDYVSMGGQLVVRDYPDDVEPIYEPDWPGYQVYVEERPATVGLPRKEAKRMLREWRARRDAQERDKRRIDKLMGGPCTKKR